MKKLVLLPIIFVSGVGLGWIIRNVTIKDIKSIKDKTEIHSASKIIYSRDRLIDSLIRTGDTILYEKLRWQYDTSMYDFLGIAMIMANKYDYTNAYEDVFECFHTVLKSGEYYDTNYNYSNYDERTKKIALEYLNVAVDRKNKNALEMICKYDKNCNYSALIDSIFNK